MVGIEALTSAGFYGEQGRRAHRQAGGSHENCKDFTPNPINAAVPTGRQADAFRAHAYLTIIVMALTNAFQTWLANQDKLHLPAGRHGQQGKETGIRKFREQVRIENCNKLIVFDEERYAIF